MSSSPFVPFARGEVLGFSYPTDNRYQRRTRLNRRCMVVQHIRDLEADPIDEVTLANDPALRRSRYLISGEDLQLHRRRSFYMGSARRLNVLEIPLFRIAAYDPLDDASPLYWGGPILTDSAADTERAKELLAGARRFIERRSRIATAVGLFPINGDRARAVPTGMPRFSPDLQAIAKAIVQLG